MRPSKSGVRGTGRPRWLVIAGIAAVLVPRDGTRAEAQLTARTLLFSDGQHSVYSN